eukprot:5278148-Pyramimonas_sp.AAC.1
MARIINNAGCAPMTHRISLHPEYIIPSQLTRLVPVLSIYPLASPDCPHHHQNIFPRPLANRDTRENIPVSGTNHGRGERIYP